jgi:very-short-patch-repair endonuclease
VADVLQAQGLRVVSQVGVGGFRIDLGIKHPDSDRYVLGVECDGATYHSSYTARDRDRLRQEVLERLGWKIHRIWSTHWLKDPARATEKVLADYERALCECEDNSPGSPRPPTNPSTEDGEGGPQPISGGALPQTDTALTAMSAGSLPAKPPLAGRYVDAVLTSQGSADEFYGVPLDALARLVRQCVEIEGPVHQDRVMRIVALSFGITRVKRRVRDRMLEAINKAMKLEGVIRRGEFLWLRGMDLPPVRAANFAGDIRKIHEVPPEEIAACTAAFLDATFSIGLEDLVVAVARELGYERTGTLVAEAIRGVIDQLLADGTLTELGGQVRLTGTRQGRGPEQQNSHAPSEDLDFYRRCICQLQPGKAGRLEPETGDNVDAICARLQAAAKAEGATLHIELSDNVIVFWVSDHASESKPDST